jgi:hypothetical protein
MAVLIFTQLKEEIRTQVRFPFVYLTVTQTPRFGKLVPTVTRILVITLVVVID